MFSRLRGPSSVFETPIYSLTLFHSRSHFLAMDHLEELSVVVVVPLISDEINATPDEDAPAISTEIDALDEYDTEDEEEPVEPVLDATEIGALDEDAIEDAHDDSREEETVLDVARINAIPDEDSRDEDAIPDPDISAENNATPGEDAPAISTEIDALGEDALEDAHDDPKEEELVLEGEDDLPEGIGIRKRVDYKYVKKKKKKRGFRDGDGSVAGEGAEDAGEGAEDAHIFSHLGSLALVSSSQFAAIDTPGNNSSSGSSTRSDATSPTL